MTSSVFTCDYLIPNYRSLVGTKKNIKKIKISAVVQCLRWDVAPIFVCMSAGEGGGGGGGVEAKNLRSDTSVLLTFT